MSKQKYTHQDVSNAVNSLVNSSYEHYDSYAYSAGYLGSVLASLITEMPAKKQATLMQMLNDSTMDIIADSRRSDKQI